MSQVDIKLRDENGYEVYLYPSSELTEKEMEKSKNLLIIGETGTGKTTFLQAISNYLKQVKFSQNKRFNLLDEISEQAGKQKVEGCSVTDEYKIYNIKSPVLGDTIYRLIDTPGLGDTRGLSMDNIIMDQIKDLLTSEGIKELHSICFVFKESATRLTERMIYIIKNLLQLFGKNAVNILTFVFTFSKMRKDGIEKPFEVIFSPASPFSKVLNKKDAQYFQFDNKSFFCNYDRDDEESAEDIERDFKKNMKRIESFFNYIKESKGISLKEGAEVLKNRDIIKSSINNSALCVKNLSGDISVMTDKIENIQKTKEESQNLLKKMNEFPDMVPEEYTDTIYEKETIEKHLYPYQGKEVLYCNSCNEPCHINCTVEKEAWFSYKSRAFCCNHIDYSSEKCKSCGCHYTRHSVQDYYVTKDVRTVPRCITRTRLVKNKEGEKAKEKISQKIKDLNQKIVEVEKEKNEYLQKLNDKLLKCVDNLSTIIAKGIELQNQALYPGDNQFKICQEVFRTQAQQTEDLSTKHYLMSFSDNIEQAKSVCGMHGDNQQKISMMKSILKIEL